MGLLVMVKQSKQLPDYHSGNGRLTGNHTPVKRAKQNGRALMIGEIDALLADSSNLKRLRRDMQLVFEIDPLAFVERFGYPLLPKQTQIDLTVGGDAVPMRIRYPDAPLLEVIEEE